MSTAQEVVLVEQTIPEAVKQDTDAALRVIDEARAHGFVIYLGGSRRMAERSPELVLINQETDYDFYVQNSPEIEHFLIDKGFQYSDRTRKVQQGLQSYDFDTSTVLVLKQGRVEISLRKDVNLYRTVFENIDPYVYQTVLWKSSPHQPNRELIQPIFNTFLSIASAAKGL